MKTFTFPSSSGTGTYTAILADDDQLLCNCKGWTMRRGQQPRHCKHTKRIAADLGVAVLPRGEFVYLAGEPARDLVGGTFHAPPPPAATAPVPMLASAMTDAVTGAAFDARYGRGDAWVMEEKINGHRCLAVVRGGQVTAWSRPQRGSAPKARTLGAHIVEQLARFPDGTYDGELVAPGGAASDVVVLGARLVLVLFDVLDMAPLDLTACPYHARRSALLDILATMPAGQTAVTTVVSDRPAWAGVEAIWQRGGEGVVLKRIASAYRPGARSADWLKVKRSEAATLGIIGFKAGACGPYSVLRLRDTAGVETTCKTLGNRLLADIAAAPDTFIGRRVVISFPGRTRTGSYGGPVILDHFAGAGE